MDEKVINMTISKYDPTVHCMEIIRLWNHTLGSKWPIGEQTLIKQIETEGTDGCFLAEQDNKAVGFVSCKLGNKGEIQVIAIDPEYQRRGIGTQLLSKSFQYFQEKNIEEVQLGAGANPYFWPGVPDNLPEAISFFRKNGWEYTEESVDMIGELTTYSTPTGIYEKIDKLGVKLVQLNNDKTIKVLDFEKKYFPDWEKYFQSALKSESGEEVIIAIGEDGEIFASALVGEKPTIWNKLLGDKIGTIGALGVKESARGKGIGFAMAAKATEILKEKGLDKSYLGWTWLVDWYGKLGYKVWRKYKMLYKKL